MNADPPDSPYAITIDDEQPLPVEDEWLRAAATRALGLLGVDHGAHLAITLVPPARIAELKEQALGYHEETDVLAYPMDAVGASPGPFVLGDIVICPEVAERQAGLIGRSTRAEICELLVHGVLHLLGWDHDGEEAERLMFAEQARILETIPQEALG